MGFYLRAGFYCLLHRQPYLNEPHGEDGIAKEKEMPKEKYGIKVGQIYIAADGSHCGHIVTDITTFADCGDVITRPFTSTAFAADGNRIDAFKLAMVRYELVSEAPAWMPSEPNA